MSFTSRKKEQLAQRAFSRFPWFKVLAGLGGVAIALVCFYPFSSPRQQGIEVTVEKKELSLPSILQMNSQQLDDVDIGLRNMLCAQGLPGSEQMNLDACMKKLDSMALRAKVETDRNFHRFFENPAEFHHSQGYFRMLMLVTVLQQDFGAVYNPERVTPVGVFEPNARFFADSRDVFVHGLLGEGRGGTCASLPILTLAVGRRLNYPLALVSAQNHLCVRWNDEREMRNFEVSCIGLNTYPDDHYRKWPYPMTETVEKENHFLRSMSAAEEWPYFCRFAVPVSWQQTAAKNHSGPIVLLAIWHPTSASIILSLPRPNAKQICASLARLQACRLTRHCAMKHPRLLGLSTIKINAHAEQIQR